MSSDPIVSSVGDPLYPSIFIGRTEAEDLLIDRDFKVAYNPHASGGAMLQADGYYSIAGGYFDGPAGVYDITLGYFDETDGVSYSQIRINGDPRKYIQWDSDAGDDIVTKAAAAESTLKGVYLEPGNYISIVGEENGGEPLRTDYLEVTVGYSTVEGNDFKVEAEDLEIISGFSIVNNGAASGRYMLQHTSGSEARAAYTMTDDGVFDVTIGYFDELDGVSSLTVLLNGEELQSFDWDSTTGSNIASKASLVEETLRNVSLRTGDQLEFVGHGDGGEPLRLDYVSFDQKSRVPFDASAAPPDLWYWADGEIVVAFNDGAGNFTPVATGIERGTGTVLEGDLNGDGVLDFLRVTTVDPLPLFDDPDDPDYQQEIELNLKIITQSYVNLGGGEFSEGSELTSTINMTLPPYAAYDVESVADFFQSADLGDVDGDGDADLLGTSFASYSTFLLENDGSNSFSVFTESPTPYLGYYGNTGQFADMNGDDALDVILSVGESYNGIVVLINDGAGQLFYVGGASPSDDGTYEETLFDVDHDGDNDIVFVAVSDGAGIYGYLNDGIGGRLPEYSLSYGNDGMIGRIEVGDFDDDPGIEVINGDYNFEGGLRVLDIFPNEDGELEFVMKSFNTDIYGSVLTSADFDHDGDLDAIVAEQDTDELLLILNDGLGNFTSAGPLFADEGYASRPFVYTAELGDLPVT